VTLFLKTLPRNALPKAFSSQPTLRDYQNGDGFGYILSFRKKGTQGWLTARVPHAESLHYVYRNESIGPYTPFEVKIKAYNRKGEGPESLTAIVYSAEEGEGDCRGACWLVAC